MTVFTPSRQTTFFRKILSSFVACAFVFSSIVAPSNVSAQGISSVLNLPIPGTMVTPTHAFYPVLVKGIEIHPENPLMFDFIMDTGDTNLNDEEFRQESSKLVKYFLAALTVPEEEMWVNLSPYEKDRIIPNSFGQTEMGRDLLAQDYILKQLAASLVYPEEELGKEFWKRVYQKSEAKYGRVDIPMNTFNKIWILPQQASVYEYEKGAFVVDSHLKVMLEEDYLALEMNQSSTEHGLGNVTKDDLEVVTGITSAVVRDILIPEIEKEVNEGEHFANLRQIYNAMILATWYKKRLKNSLLGQVYVDQHKTSGIQIEAKANQEIYEQYVEAFKKGVYDYIKEDYDETTQEIIPRKYFSGGASAKGLKNGLAMVSKSGSSGIGTRGSAKRVVAGVGGVFGDGASSSVGSRPVILDKSEQDIKIKFGTNGWRELIRSDEYPEAPVTENNFGRTAKAAGQDLLEQIEKSAYQVKNVQKGPRVFISYDARVNGIEYAKKQVEVYAALGFDVTMSDSYAATPEVVAMTDAEVYGEDAFDLAIHITASHNDFRYQGMKVAQDGIVIPDSHSNRIVRRANDHNRKRSYHIIPFEETNVKVISLKEYYRKRVDESFPTIVKDMQAYIEANSDKTFIVDRMHGSAKESTAHLEEMGFEVIRSTPMSEGTYPQGLIDGEPYRPEPLEKFLDQNKFNAFKEDAKDGSLYFAIDGDGDRLKIWVKYQGDTVDLNPNDLIVLYGWHLYDTGRAEGKKYVLKTQPTTYGVNALAELAGLELIVTPVGSKNFKPYRRYALVGGEESGHVDVLGFFDDGAIQATLLLEILTQRNQSLVDSINDSRVAIGFSGVNERINVQLTDELKKMITDPLKENPQALVDQIAEVIGKKVVDVTLTDQTEEDKVIVSIDKLKNIDVNNGINIRFEDNSWLQIRLSGTEPVARFYTEAQSKEAQQQLHDEAVKAIGAEASAVKPVLPRIKPILTESWSKLKRLVEGSVLSLRELFEKDPNRQEKMTVKMGEEFSVDFSNQLIDGNRMAALLEFAQETQLSKSIELMFMGEKINETEDRAVLHAALRNIKLDENRNIVTANGSMYVDGKDVMPDVIRVLNKMKEFTEKVRSGEWKGASGKAIKHVVNVGIGGSDLGPKMAARALKPYGNDSGITAHFVSNVDGTAAAELIRELNLNPEETLIVIESKTFTTQETIQNALTLKNWVIDFYENVDNVSAADAIKKHFVAVSTNTELVKAFGIDTENMFEFWDWVGGRYSMWSAIGLSLATFIGFDNFLEMLEGAREADEHFRNEPFEKNIPVLKALIGILNRNHLNAETNVILPYDEYAALIPAYLQQAVMESNGKSTDRLGNLINDYQTSQVVLGAAGTDGQHSFYQAIHQSTNIMPADFIGVIQSQNPLPGHHEKLYANFIAQPYALARGFQFGEVLKALDDGNVSDEELHWMASHQTFPGNKPTTSIVIDKLTPRALGRLIATYENEIAAAGFMLNIFSFDQWGVQLGKVVASEKVLGFLDGSRPLSELDQVPSGNTIRTYVKNYLDKQAQGDDKTASSSGVGGIDLNSEALDLQLSNEGEFKFPLPTHEMIQDLSPATGFVPTIHQIVPITNLPLVLGLVDQDETQPIANQTDDSLDQARNEYFDRIRLS